MVVGPPSSTIRFGNDWNLSSKDYQGEAAEAYAKTQALISSVDRANSQDEANITLERVYADDPVQLHTAISSAHSSDHQFLRYLSSFLLEKTQPHKNLPKHKH